jgi:hypothetical protein
VIDSPVDPVKLDLVDLAGEFLLPDVEEEQVQILLV